MKPSIPIKKPLLHLFQGDFDPQILTAYFEKIGFVDKPGVTLKCLKLLHALHPQAIPFENLSPLLGLPVSLEGKALWLKFVKEGRGGYCFEHNLMFGNVLKSLGFEARGLSARVFWEVGEDEVKPRDHMLLLVEAAGKRYIADVGFGGISLTAPLELNYIGIQKTSHESYRVTLEGDFYYLEILIKQKWRLMYRFTLEEQLLPDYDVVSWYLCTHEKSIFTRDLMVARCTSWGRYSLFNNRLSTYHLDGTSDKKFLSSVAQLKEVLEVVFLIDLPRHKELDRKLGTLLKEK